MAQKNKAKKPAKVAAKVKKAVKAAPKKAAKAAPSKKKVVVKAKATALPKKVHSKSNHKKVAVTGSVKTKLKAKLKVAPPLKKIEKIIDITQLETKFKEISHFDSTESTVEEKLKALFILQQIDSNIDKIRTIRGELP